MQAMAIQEQARKLLDARGDQALPLAAQKASEHERRGDREQAATWRRIEGALMHMRGPRFS